MSHNNSTILNRLSSLQSNQLALPIAIAAGILLVSRVVLTLFRSKKEDEIEELGGWSVVTAWYFFAKRHDFLKKSFLKTGKNMFSFKVLQYSVTAIQGDEARVAFFDNKSLHFNEGYKILRGAAPALGDIGIANVKADDVSWSSKMLLKLLKKNRLNDILPSFLDDIQACTETWGREGIMDPFKNIYDLVFQITVRMATCRELASNIEEVKRLQSYITTYEMAATPTSLLLPWLPSRAKRDREAAIKAVLTMLRKYVEDRRNADVPSNDAIDVCIRDEELSNDNTISFIMLVVFAGTASTGIVSAWALLFLAFHTQWRDAVKKELAALVRAHTNITSNEPIHKCLGQIPASVWEDEMPVLDAVIRETMRITLNSTALRRNIHDDTDMVGKKFPKGHFFAYPISDAHLNPEYYTNPMEFDPTRFSPGREEDKKAPYAFLGWGAGRHPCPGMKVAKLEIKLMVTVFLTAYEFSIVDQDGKPATKLPTPDYNNIQQARPVDSEPGFLKFKRVIK